MPQHDDLRMLLVDDDPAVIRAYGSALARHGVTAETASNGKDAVARVKAGSFDVIVSDIAMPEMTGIEFLKSVRAHDLEVPVILMTGEPSLESAVHAVEYGAFRYMAKPVAVPGTLGGGPTCRETSQDGEAQASGVGAPRSGWMAARRARRAGGSLLRGYEADVDGLPAHRRMARAARLRLRGTASLGRTVDEEPRRHPRRCRKARAAPRLRLDPSALGWPRQRLRSQRGPSCSSTCTRPT